MCGHTPGKVAGRQETVKAEMNGLTPGLDRSPPPRWMGGQGGQSLKVFGRTRSFWGLSSPKIEMGGKALKWLSRLDYPLAKTGETVNGGAESAVHLDRCKCQYKNVGFISYKRVGKPTCLYDIF